MVPRRPDDAAVRRFALAGPPERGRFELFEGEVEHARRVLRLKAGDRLVGLDGAGSAWPLRVRVADARAFEVEADGDPATEPEPGEPGAPLPWIEVCAPLPRGERAEALVDRLVQLGAAAIRPLLAERATPEARGEGSRRDERLRRVVRQACAQSGRLWAPEIHAAEAPARILERPAELDLMLDPRAAGAPLALLGDVPLAGTRERPVRLWAGPEGGFSPAETAALATAGARPLRIAPHVLRIETAAEAALALVVAASLGR